MLRLGNFPQICGRFFLTPTVVLGIGAGCLGADVAGLRGCGFVCLGADSFRNLFLKLFMALAVFFTRLFLPFPRRIPHRRIGIHQLVALGICHGGLAWGQVPAGAWRIDLELANKPDLAKVGAAKKVDAGKAARGKQLGVLSPGDKTPAPNHNTRAEIAAKANTSTGQVGMAEVVGLGRWRAKKPRARRGEVAMAYPPAAGRLPPCLRTGPAKGLVALDIPAAAGDDDR